MEELWVLDEQFLGSFRGDEFDIAFHLIPYLLGQLSTLIDALVKEQVEFRQLKDATILHGRLKNLVQGLAQFQSSFVLH